MNRSKLNRSPPVPSLLHNDSLLSTPEDKAELLSSVFSTNFNHTTPSLPEPPLQSVFSCPSDHLVTADLVSDTISHSSGDPSPGEDQISAKGHCYFNWTSTIYYIQLLSQTRGLSPILEEFKNYPNPKNISPSFLC